MEEKDRWVESHVALRGGRRRRWFDRFVIYVFLESVSLPHCGDFTFCGHLRYKANRVTSCCLSESAVSCECGVCCVKSVKRQVDTVSHLYNRDNEVAFEPIAFTNSVFKLSLFVILVCGVEWAWVYEWMNEWMNDESNEGREHWRKDINQEQPYFRENQSMSYHDHFIGYCCLCSKSL